MWFFVAVTVIIIIALLVFIVRRSDKYVLKDRDEFDKYVAKNNLSMEEQRELCNRLDLPYQIGRRSYDSVEDWLKELTIIWTGETKVIEFTYRKYDERERRKISPIEFGYDGNNRAYIKGVCHSSNEVRTFKTSRIETKIQVGSKRLNIEGWVESYLDLDVSSLRESFQIML